MEEMAVVTVGRQVEETVVVATVVETAAVVMEGEGGGRGGGGGNGGGGVGPFQEDMAEAMVAEEMAVVGMVVGLVEKKGEVEKVDTCVNRIHL